MGPAWWCCSQDECPGLLDSEVGHALSAHLLGPGSENQKQTGLSLQQCHMNPSSPIQDHERQHSHRQLHVALTTEHRLVWTLTYMATWWATLHQPPDSLRPANNSHPSECGPDKVTPNFIIQLIVVLPHGPHSSSRARHPSTCPLYPVWGHTHREAYTSLGPMPGWTHVPSSACPFTIIGPCFYD